jgi:hypothetical protein
VTFNIAALSAVRPLEPQGAALVYRALNAGRRWQSLLAADANIEAFASELQAEWPDLSTLTHDNEQLEDSPWGADLDVSPAHVIATVLWTSAEEVEVAFLAMAMRHGVYAYDPQTDRLYDPHQRADQEACAERERQAEDDRLQQTSTRKAKGGRALAGEAMLAVLADVLSHVGMTPVEETAHEVRASFPISDEVEGRASFWPQGGRTFTINGRIGAAHLDFEKVWQKLWQGPDFFTVSEHCSSHHLDAYDPDLKEIEAFEAKVAKKVARASILTDLERVLPVLGLRQHPTKGGRASLVALSMTGRQVEAEQELAYWVQRTWSPVYKHPTERDGEQVNDEFMERYNELFDEHYRNEAAGPLANLKALGLEVDALSDLRRLPASEAAKATPVVIEWAAGGTYVPLERDLVVLLGKPWALPSAAGFLARHFCERALGDAPDPSLLAAIGESFASTASSSDFAQAAEIASDHGYGVARGMFIIAIQRMSGVSDQALPLLVSLLDDPAMAPFALDAIGTMKLRGAHSAVERLVNDRHRVTSERAEKALAQLK